MFNKRPGVRAIGVGEVSRWIMSKAILFVLKGTSRKLLVLATFVSQIAGIEAAIHSVREMFESEATEAMLLIDTRNAFNSEYRFSLISQKNEIR